MAQQTINIGSSANDGTGDPLRTAFDKINDNFSELYGSTAEANDLIEDSTPQLGGDLDVNGRRITSARSNEDIILLPNGTGGVVASAIRIAGTTISSDDSSTININEGLVVDGTASVSGAATLSSTLAVTGAATLSSTLGVSGATTLTTTNIDNLTIQDSNITSSSNADINITPGGTGSTIIGSSITIKGTTISSADSSTININEGLVVDGTGNFSGTLTTAALTTVGTHTVTGQADIEGVTIKDNTVSSNASNSDLEITANGTGKVEIDRLAVGVPYEYYEENIRGKNTAETKPNLRDKGNCWFVPYETISNRIKHRGKHPATFPIALIEHCIKFSGIKKGLLVDPFIGSGTSAIAAIRQNIDYIGFDIDKDYIDFANLRIQDANKEKMFVEE